MDRSIAERLTLPVICAPMFQVTGPALVREACRAGVIGALPRANAHDISEFSAWLTEIEAALVQDRDAGRIVAPIAVNLGTRLPRDELRANLAVTREHGVDIVISAAGDPTALIAEVHDWGGKVFHDVTSLRFAEKAIAAGADGLICIGAGGGGHSGTISHLALIPQIRAIFDGTIIMAGAVSSGAAVRAAELLGADLAYMGTRFIATQESGAPEEYKQLLVSQTSADLLYTPKIAGVSANWMMESMRRNGLDPANLPEPRGKGMGHDHLPPEVRPWKTLWSAGQGIDLIHDIPSVATLVERLRAEYDAACDAPRWAARA